MTQEKDGKKESHYHGLFPIAEPRTQQMIWLQVSSGTRHVVRHPSIAKEIFVYNSSKWLRELKTLHIKSTVLQLISCLVSYLGGKDSSACQKN